MRLAYLDCFAGISGDMFLGALIDAGLDPSVLEDAVRALPLDASLRIEKVDRSGITSTKVHVLEAGHLAEAPHDDPHGHEHEHEHGHKHPQGDGPEEQPLHEQHAQPRSQHLHKAGHAHAHPHEPHTHDVPEDRHPGDRHEAEGHAHPHVHGRSLTAIRQLLRDSALDEPVKRFAIQTFELLGSAEARIHNVPVDEIHFHEVGAVDAIVDITCASAGIHALNQQALAETGQPLRWHASPVNVGGGTVQCAHGNFPVPAPATADLLRGLPTYSAHLEKELVTPTGAALLCSLAPSFGPQPAMRVAQIGYGAGSRNPERFPNVLRLSLGEAVRAPATVPDASAGLFDAAPEDLDSPGPGRHSAEMETVTVLETALDDLSPQVLAYVTDLALRSGALDVMTTPVTMKKGRLGTLLTVLTDDRHSPALERLLLRETSTLGIRVRTERRICLHREHRTVTTAFGNIRVKVGSFDAEELNAAPEFEDCRTAAAAHGVALKQVMQAAMAAYLAPAEPL